MPNNGKRTQYIGLGTAVLIAGGGGGVIGANTHEHDESAKNTAEITDLKVVQGEVNVRLKHIEEDIEDNKESSKEILHILRESMDRDRSE